MALRKCPACKNTVSRETRWCPICGIDFRSRRIRRVLLVLALLAGALYWFRDRLPAWPDQSSSGPAVLKSAQTGRWSETSLDARLSSFPNTVSSNRTTPTLRVHSRV
jgi:hypothetical protein